MNRKKIYWQVLAVILFFLIIVFFSQLSSRHLYRQVFHTVCELVEERYFEWSHGLQEWSAQCARSAQQTVGLWTSRQQLLDLMQRQLNVLEASHLTVFDPREQKRVWTGRAVDTGLRGRSIQGEYVVTEILPGSAAESAGVLVGDLVVSLNGREMRSLWQAQVLSGQYGFIRQGERFEVDIEATELKIDSSPSVTRLSDTAGLLRISSFRRNYFEKSQWLELVQEFSDFNHIIIDIRGNPGGNFVAALRALSPFFCEPRVLGRVLQPRRQDQEVPEVLPDNIDDLEQLRYLENHPHLLLSTYQNYGCYNGQVTVLIDTLTSSVAEIFAQGFYLHPQARVWGSATPGHVVLAVWYGLSQLGEGYSLSIPEAIYKTDDGIILEGRGVWPEKTLFYQLDEALAGQDSWILRAQQESFK